MSTDGHQNVKILTVDLEGKVMCLFGQDTSQVRGVYYSVCILEVHKCVVQCGVCFNVSGLARVYKYTTNGFPVLVAMVVASNMSGRLTTSRQATSSFQFFFSQ